jgi:hypothetical protein
MILNEVHLSPHLRLAEEHCLLHSRTVDARPEIVLAPTMIFGDKIQKQDGWLRANIRHLENTRVC